MSKKSISKQLLSAYFDGEVTEDERAMVNRAAQQTPAVRRVLDDYAQLSESLQSLRQDVPTPDLRETVLAALPVSSTPASSVAAGRRWMPMAGIVTAAAAAGLLLMVWPAGPQVGDRAEVATAPLEQPAESMETQPTEMALADNSPTVASATRFSDMADEDVPADAPALAESDADETPLRVASLPVESLLRQVAKDRQIPKPGDVVKYLVDVADETVWIPLTVIDVQDAAGEIRVLLAKHGIESPVDEDVSASQSTDSNIVILVESDWEKVAQVMDDLNTQEYGAAADVESSIVMQKVMIEQNRLEPLAEGLIQNAQRDLAAASPAEESTANELGRTARPSPVASSLAKPQSDMLHAQLAAPVSDEFVQEIELRGRSLFSGPNVVADAAREEQESAAAESVEPKAETRRNFSGIYGTQGPARVVFVIKKSK